MEEFTDKISLAVQKGKVDINSPYPPYMKGQPGADELTRAALDAGVSANEILNSALIPAMAIVGGLFREKKLFVPQVLMSARAMSRAMVHLKPYFTSGEIRERGVFVVGTVAGDLHDIGKNLASMMIEGSGWRVVDLGVDVKSEKFIEAAREYPGCIIGMSALLTTTMESMEMAVREMKGLMPDQKVIVGGAPLNAEFAHRIGADLYAQTPQSAVSFLNSLS